MKTALKVVSFLSVLTLLAPVMIFALTPPPSTPIPGANYTLDTLFSRVDDIVNWVFAFIIVLSVLWIILAGFEFVTGGPDGAAKAREKLIWAAVGIGVAVLSRAIPAALRVFLQ